PLSQTDAPLDVGQWSAVVNRVFGGTQYEVCIEPGTFLVKNAGVLVLEANTVEIKSGQRFIGVNAGFDLAMEPAHYKLPCEPTPCVFEGQKDDYFAKKTLVPTTVAGNINEALDVWNENLLFPEIKEAALIAFVNAGAYTTSMSSHHCMRGDFSEYLLL
ncbi:MAG: diaminopimelate decarboxylase, partial [Candidatus Electrothrix sp. MAN1_4]|nr:diaminopimelate decarboxylase [Candidatus Electrothrix sp. MAN1_4]